MSIEAMVYSNIACPQCKRILMIIERESMPATKELLPPQWLECRTSSCSAYQRRYHVPTIQLDELGSVEHW